MSAAATTYTDHGRHRQRIITAAAELTTHGRPLLATAKSVIAGRILQLPTHDH
ncbi:MAG: hypothetical protein ACRDOJ_10715 [Nocardioidaceae bacterium]